MDPRSPERHGWPMIDSIDHFVLTVRDVAAASAWYERVLGMTVVEFGQGRTALRFGSQKINLHPAGAEFAPHAAVPAPGSADFCLISREPLDAIATRLAANNVRIELGPVTKQGALGPIESVYFRDLDENLVEVSNYHDRVEPETAWRTESRSATGRRSVIVYQVNAFTRRRFTGNPAGVVLDASGLSDGEMQAIAFELGNPESAFLLPPTDADHDVRIRYFSPTTEVPLCGHATIAAHHVRALTSRAPSGVVVQRGLAGDLPVEISDRDGDYRVTLTLAPPIFEPPLGPAAVDALVDALGISRGGLLPGAPPQVVAAGHGKVIVGLTTRETLFGLAPDMRALTALSRRIGCNGYHVFTFDTGDESVLTTCRMFAPAIGISEDPVTGNGNGPLGAYLVKHALAEHDGRALRFKSAQGASVGRPGIVKVTVAIENGEPTRVTIGDEAVIVFRAELFL
jgi:PhzF family phenazine biosynthesis protein